MSVAEQKYSLLHLKI